MTVSNVTPRIEYPNTTGVDTFAYGWDMSPDSEIIAILNNDELTGVVDNGGTVTITPMPIGNLLLKRRTQVWQPENYAFARAFKANKTELTLDRSYMIAQEMDSTGNVAPNIFTIRAINGIIVDSELGANAALVLWGGGLAGLFSGEITQTAPDDDTVTTYPESFVWMQHQTATFESVSSWTYPVSVVDEFGAAHSAGDGQMISWLPLEFEVTHSVVSGELITTREFISHTQPPEEFEVTHDVVAGELITTRAFISHTQPPEEFEVTHDVIAGELITTREFIAHTQPPEEFAVTHDVISGELITV